MLPLQEPAVRPPYLAFTLGGIGVALLAATVLRVRHLRFVFDDFEFAAAFRELGFVGQLEDAYHRFSGRTALLLFGGWQSASGPQLAAVCGALALLGLVVCLVILFSRVGCDMHTRMPLQKPLLPTGLLAVFFAGFWASTAPAQSQVLHWSIGSIVYLYPMTFVAAGLVWATAGDSTRSRSARLALGAISCLALFIGSGGNETTAFVAPAAFIALVVNAKTAQRRFRSLVGLLFTSGGCVVLFTAPGQRNRAALGTVDRSLEGVVGVGSSILRAILELCVDRLWALLLAAMVGAIATASLDWSIGSVGALVALLALGSWATLVSVGAIGSGSVPPLRAVTTPWLLTQLSAACGGSRIAEIAYRRIGSASLGTLKSWTKGIPVNVCFALLILMPFVTSQVKVDQGEAKVAHQLDCLDSELRKAPDGTAVDIVGPELVRDIWYARFEATAWPNQRMAAYYRLKSVSNRAAHTAEFDYKSAPEQDLRGPAIRIGEACG